MIDGARLMKRINHNRTLLIPATVVVAALLSSCRPYHMYAGGQRAPGDTSTIVHSDSVVLMAIDGGDTGLSSEFRLLPGPHTIAVHTYRLSYVPVGHGGSRKKVKYPGCLCDVQLETQPGAAYLVDAKEVSEDAWIAWVGPFARDSKRPDNPESLPHCTCTRG